MSNSNPNPSTRFTSEANPTRGKPKRDWIRKIINERNPDGHTEREQILRHQIEIAKSWEVRVIGKGSDGELLKVASGSDSTKAAQFLFGLIGLKPVPGEDDPGVVMALAEHLRQTARDQVDIALRALGAKAATMQPEQLADFIRMCGQDARGFLRAAEEEIARAAGTTEPAPPPSLEPIPEPTEPQPAPPPTEEEENT